MAIDLVRSNQPEWAELYRRHAPDVRRVIVRNVPPEAPVDDLVQEVFYQAYRSRDRVDLSQSAGGLLATIAHRVCIAWWRRQRIDGEPWDAAERIDPAAFPGSDEHVAAMDFDRRVSTALARLSERHRSLLLGHAEGELSCEHLARAEGSSPKAVKSALNRARTHFRKHMEDLPVAAVVCRRWYARAQRTAPAAEGLGPWVGAVVTLGVMATLSMAPVALREDGRERRADDATRVAADDLPAGADAPQGATSPPAGAARQSPPPASPSPAAQLPAAAPHPAGAGVAAAGIATHADVTRSPEGTWTIFEVQVGDPIGTDTTVGASVRCTAGTVATVACSIGQMLPNGS